MRVSLLSLLPLAAAAPGRLFQQAVKPVYWLLAGDSTTAPDGGWGDAFLATTVAKGSSGHNYGHSGASTKSFRDGGDWKKVITDVGTYKKDYRVYVTIQVSLAFPCCIIRGLKFNENSSATTTRNRLRE
jgi:hypothetical protein